MAKGAYIGVNNVARKIKKGYVGIENFTKRNLPAGYTQVEYIESTGSQYFDSGFKPNQNTRVVMEFQLTKESSNYRAILGVRDTAADTSPRQFVFWNYPSEVFRTDFFGTNQTISGLTRLARMTLDKNKNVTTVGGQTITNTAASGQCTQNLYLFCVNEAGTAKYFAEAKGWPTKVYDNGTLIRDYIPCTNSTGAAGFYDMVNGTFGGDAAGVGFVAGPTYKGIARKIKKAYIGIGGVARPCWSGGELAYYGTVTELQSSRYQLAATTVGNYALFGGGRAGSSVNKGVDAYNSSLTHIAATNFNYARYQLAATTVGNYALFFGGYDGSSIFSQGDAYNASLTRSTPTALSESKYAHAATSVGNYALFAGGIGGSGQARTAVVNAYNASLTRSTPTALNNPRYNLAATTVGDYALFAGGQYTNSSFPAVVDTYNTSLTRSSATELSTARHTFAATTVGDYALFAGGSTNSTTFFATVDVYDKSLTRTNGASLSLARGELAATTVGDYALFGGGRNGSTKYNTVDVYGTSLTRTTQTGLAVSIGTCFLAATSIGDYALFGGGWNGMGPYTTVTAYTVA